MKFSIMFSIVVPPGSESASYPQAWLADVLARLPDHPAKWIDELLPWNCRPQNAAPQAA